MAKKKPQEKEEKEKQKKEKKKQKRKKSLKFEDLLALYKYMKNVHGEVVVLEEKIEKQIYDLKLCYGELARRIKELELRE